MSVAEILLVIATGIVAGGFAGAMGVGGGVIMVPVLTELVGIGQRVAQGTSLLVIVVTATVATIGAYRRGLLDVALASKVAIGSAFGAVGGAMLATRVVDERTLRRIFGVLVLLVAARLLRRLLVSDPDT